MNFNIKNIFKHFDSTFKGILLGLILLLVTLILVWEGKATFSEISPAFLVIVPFLLYGKKDNDNNCPMPPAAAVMLVLVLFSSCKPQQVIRDVQIIRDTIHVKGETIERNFHYAQKDTVLLKGDKLTMKYYYHHYDSTVFLQGICKAETLYLEKLVPFEKVVIPEKNFFENWKIPIIAFVAGFVGFFVLRIILKRIDYG